MGLLLAAAFLILPGGFLSSGASQQSQLPKRHRAAPQRAGAGACGRQRNDGGKSETHLCLPWGTLDLLHFGARSRLLLDAEN